MNKANKKNPRGAGRKPISPGYRKIQRSIRLPAWLWELLDSKRDSPTSIIERVLIEEYDLNNPIDIGLLVHEYKLNEQETISTG